jgi:hypothetical protein
MLVNGFRGLFEKGAQMTDGMAHELAALARMTTKQLREKYLAVFDEESRSSHKQWLVRRIAWRLQALAEGDLSERARRRAAELADDSQVRVTPPKTVVIPLLAGREDVAPAIDPRLPPPGTCMTRSYKGRTVEVRVVADGFQYDGRRYKSLSAVARAITQTHCNGFRFFGLGGQS